VLRLADIVSAEGVFDTLVDPRQPSWFLYEALRALALFTSSEFQRSLNSSLEFSDGHTQQPFVLVTLRKRAMQTVSVRAWD
jgi:hypothetical protein